LRAKARLGVEKLLFNTPILINPKTWHKNKNEQAFTKTLGSITPMHEGYSSL
jgi:hypothetical protein